jgi:hypothetical protein
MVTQLDCNLVEGQTLSTQLSEEPNQLELETTYSSIAIGLILLVVGLVPLVGCRIYGKSGMRIIMYLDVNYVRKQMGYCNKDV